MKLLGRYNNGNYHVAIFDDGTKIRETVDPSETEFKARFPESIDLKITNSCNLGCDWCHEDSTPDGKHGNINLPFLKTLRPYTEVAIGGGNPLTHPQLTSLLKQFHSYKVFSNITVSQEHFMENQSTLLTMVSQKLIHGIGISYTHYSDDFVTALSMFPNAVIHVINGINSVESISKLYNKGLKLLILGYKQIRRGADYHSSRKTGTQVVNNQYTMDYQLPEIIDGFNVVSFDNLALEQLIGIKDICKDTWKNHYQGDDGSHTMYIDLVKEEYAVSSTSTIRFPLIGAVELMFESIQTSI